RQGRRWIQRLQRKPQQNSIRSKRFPLRWSARMGISDRLNDYACLARIDRNPLRHHLRYWIREIVGHGHRRVRASVGAKFPRVFYVGICRQEELVSGEPLRKQASRRNTLSL